MGTSQHFQSILIAVNFEIASAQGCQHVRMIKFGLFNFRKLRIFLEGDCQMIDCLLIAFIVEVGLADVVMSFD